MTDRPVDNPVDSLWNHDSEPVDRVWFVPSRITLRTPPAVGAWGQHGDGASGR